MTSFLREKKLIWSVGTGSPVSKKIYFYWQTQVWREEKGPEKKSFKNAGKQSKMEKKQKQKKVTQVYKYRNF